MMFSNNYALVLSGGSGTRFWPVSRKSKPKQFLSLFFEKTLLEQTIERLEGVVEKENIYILTNPAQVEQILAVSPEFNQANILVEPSKRDTAPAISYGMAQIAKINKQANVVVLPSDQLIDDHEAFSGLIKDAFSLAAKDDYLITLGVKPTWACSSYGYIEKGEAIDSASKSQAHQVLRFREKPATELAEKFLKSGDFSWNAGIFIWSVAGFSTNLQQHAPQLAEYFTAISQDSLSSEAECLAKFESLEALSIDYALMERSTKVLVMEVAFSWDDIGSWISAAEYLPLLSDENKSNQSITALEARGNIVFNSEEAQAKHVALLGVDDLVIVQTADALLVANKHQVEQIKKLVELLPSDLL